MTKAEFHLDIAGLYDNKDITESIAIEAMKQHAIEFAEWIYHNVSEEEWQRTTNEILYDQFNNQEP